MINKFEDKDIHYIDTSIMTDNVAMVLSDSDDVKNISAVLEIYSFAVQFSSKTLDENISKEKRNRYAELQNEAESKTRDVIRKLDTYYKAQFRSVLKAGAIAGLVLGASLIGFLNYLW